MQEKNVQMKLSLEVKGSEEMDIVVNYKNTDIETVKLVENALMEALASLNKK